MATYTSMHLQTLAAIILISCKPDHGDRARGNFLRSTSYVPSLGKSSWHFFSYSVRVSRRHRGPGGDSSGWIRSTNRDKLANCYLRMAVHSVTTSRGLLVSAGSIDSLTPPGGWGRCPYCILPIRVLEAGSLRRTFQLRPRKSLNMALLILKLPIGSIIQNKSPKAFLDMNRNKGLCLPLYFLLYPEQASHAISC